MSSAYLLTFAIVYFFNICYGFMDYNSFIQSGTPFPSYMSYSPDLWVSPYLTPTQKKTHPFFGSFPHASLIDNCTEQFMEQVIDHFNWRPAANGQTTYKQRYFVCSGAKWTPNNTIFFYTGNEANVELYVNHTGLMWENADDFGAILVFAEHRYYGASILFDNNTMDNQNDYIYYANADQALADFAVMIRNLKNDWNSLDSPVIGFGGSYGGMLCAWFRMKYPASMDGCIAGSAPILACPGLTPPLITNYAAKIETYACTQRGHINNDVCHINYHSTFELIANLSQTPQGREDLKTGLRLCKTPNTAAAALGLRSWIGSAIFVMAEGSYPYASSYMLGGRGLLPPYPLKIGCNNHLNRNFAENEYMQLLDAASLSVGVYYNYTGGVDCYNAGLYDERVKAEEDGQVSWGYFECTEIVMPHSSTGVDDMFWDNPFDLTQYVDSCHRRYGTWPQPTWQAVNWGGWDIGMAGITNIVFSNGELDPWRGGGVTLNLSESLPSIVIEDSGHHIDLYFTNPNDTVAITNAREFELDQMRGWIKQKRENQNLKRKVFYKNDL